MKLGVLYNPHEPHPPSSLRTLKYFRKLAKKHNVNVELITVYDTGDMKSFDGFFIRTEPFIGNEAYWFATKAYKLGIPIDDDPLSIIQSTDKCYMHGLFEDGNVSCPDTVIITREDEAELIAEEFGYPLVLKIPNGSFSKGVYKVENEDMLRELLKHLFRTTKKLVAQRYTPTEFDWRVGIIGGKPLYVCRYFMAPEHWQIIKHGPKSFLEGRAETLELSEAPEPVVSLALKAASLVGNGLYGVDLKQVGDKIMVIEVNDNPTIEHGIEDEKDPELVWIKIINWFKGQ